MPLSFSLSFCHDQTPLRKKEEEETEGKLDSNSRRLAEDRFRWDTDNNAAQPIFHSILDPFFIQARPTAAAAAVECVYSLVDCTIVSRGSPYSLLLLPLSFWFRLSVRSFVA